MSDRLELVEALTKRGFSEKQAGEALEVVYGDLAQRLAKGEAVRIPGFGEPVSPRSSAPRRPTSNPWRRKLGDRPPVLVAELNEIQRLFKLTLIEFGGLFGVSRQAVSGWLEEGVPASRMPKVATVLNIAELLERQLKAGRLPAIARRQASAYGGLSILEMIAADRHDELLQRVRASFNWAASA